jgi:Domain of unknown function (DUF1992)
MSLESAIEEKIREAIERGEFDNLDGKGKPIDLNAYFETPEDLRMAFSMLRSNEFVPQEVELMREIASLRDRARTITDENERSRLISEAENKALSLRLALENRQKRR